MSENRLFAVPVIVALLVVGSLTAWQAAASPDVVPDSAGAAASGIGDSVRAASLDTGDLEACFDVSLSELAGCRMAGHDPIETGQATARPLPLPPNECFDVSLSEVCEE